jgi:hypothetical protein
VQINQDSFGGVRCLVTLKIMATVVPPTGLAPGSKYQMVFVTADGTPATSTDIFDYNAFARSEAAPLNSLLPPGVTARSCFHRGD